MYRTTILRRVREQRLLHSVSIELTYQCNLNCFYCYNDRAKQGRPLSLDSYRDLFRDLAGMQTLFLMFTGGEPLLHPRFFEIGRMSRDFGFVVRVRTNGHILDSRTAERLKNEVQPYSVEISLHGATAEVHDRQTLVGGSFDRLVENIRTGRKAGLRCECVCTPTGWNQHQIREMFALCDELQVRLRFQGPVGPRDNGDTAPLAIQPSRKTWDLILELQEKRQAKERSEEFVDRSAPFFTENRTTHPSSVTDRFSCCVAAPDQEDLSGENQEEQAMCGVGLSGVDIDPFGNVQACMHLQEPAGNLREQSIRDIWNNSPVFRRARQRAREAAIRFGDRQPRQYGAPLFCIAVEENAQKGLRSG